ncbi:MAG: helix-turn-helix domain-containing protein [Desulfocapsa sp.]|nr:helix-turn-helix domain-containing protein [Desulfocapsa sp.]
MIIDERKYTVKEAAQKSRMSEAWWRRAILEKKVEVLRVGRKILIPESTMANIYQRSKQI